MPVIHLPANQLNLFKGKQQRGDRPRAADEFRLQVSLADVLRRWCAPGWIWTHLPFGEHRNEITGARLKRMGTGRGWPDFVFAHIEGATAWLELKRRGGRLSQVQANRAFFFRTRGDRYLCTDDFNEAVAWLREVGIVSSRLRAAHCAMTDRVISQCPTRETAAIE